MGIHTFTILCTGIIRKGLRNYHSFIYGNKKMLKETLQVNVSYNSSLVKKNENYQVLFAFAWYF